MFESYINREFESISRNFNSLQRIYLRDILESEVIPAKYKIFFENEILNLIYYKNIERKNENHFELDNEELSELFARIDQIYFLNSYFSSFDFKEKLFEAVKITTNYIIRPRFTLSSFLYGGESIKTVDELLRKLNYFTDYPYLISNIKHLINEKKKQPGVILHKEFADIAEQADKTYLFDLTPDEFAALPAPIFEAFENRAPIEAIIVFLHDKKLYYLSNDFQSKLNRGIEFIDNGDFKNILLKVLTKSSSSNEDSKSVVAEVETGAGAPKNDLYDEKVEAEACDIEETEPINPEPASEETPDTDIDKAPEIKQ